ncbi:MAG: filamentous hemagglutinin N-terminal domain-containing protein, partial [Elsteraceae bacterium]
MPNHLFSGANTARIRLHNNLLTSTAAIAMVAFVAPVGAQTPTGPTVASGSVGITQNGLDTVVKQDSTRAIVDWRSFSVGPNGSVRFDQPSGSSVILNRVTGSEVSRIDGRISANGQVWLANPNGAVIGPSGQVNVGGLLMTTGRVDESVFLRSGGAAIDQIARDAKILNQGAVMIAEGGYAALAAAAIKNEGAVVARKGDVAFGAGRAMTLDFAGDKLITFQVTKPLDQAPAGSDSMISGAGSVNAAGGSVVMSARAAKGVMDTVINLKGHVVANSVKVDGGTVTFGDGGVVQVAGKIDASATAGVGGRVEVLGPKVGLMEGATIDASGAAGGGTVLIGGDWQGKGAVQNAEVAYVAPGVSINVDATHAGSGGKVVVWADDTTRFDGMISARGGIVGGDGGQVETSGKSSLLVGENTTVTTEARAKGWKTGEWLLDPTDIEITDFSTNKMTKTGGLFQPSMAGVSMLAGSTIASQLKTTSVTVQTSNPGKGLVGGNINVTGNITTTKANPSTLTLIADDNITISGTIRLKFPDQHLVLIAGAQATTQAAVNGYVKLDSNIFTEGGSVTMGGGVNGKFALQSPIGGALLGNGGIITTTGTVTIRGQGDPNVAGASSIGVEVGYIQGGIIDIEGTGGKATSGSAAGVVANRLLSRFSGGSITVKGTGGTGSGTNSEGVRITQSADAYLGPITITGTGGAIGENQGVILEGATISSGATATIKGTAGSPNGAEGVKVMKNATSGEDSKLYIGRWDEVTESTYTPTGGSLIIEGVGGSRSGVSSVSMANTLIEAQDGALTIKGTDLSGGGANTTGVTIGADSVITTSTGSINISGVGSSTGAGNAGVKISGGAIKATGDGGSIKINTPGGTNGGGDILMDSNASISYAGGVATDLKLEASRNVVVGATASINLSGGDHNLILNSGAEATSQSKVKG